MDCTTIVLMLKGENQMRDNVMFIPACVLMVVEAIALVYLVLEWRKAKKEERHGRDDEGC